MSEQHQGIDLDANEERETLIDELVRRVREAATPADAEIKLRRIFEGAGVELPEATEELRKIADRMRRGKGNP